MSTPNDYQPEVGLLLSGKQVSEEERQAEETIERAERRADRADEKSFRRNQRWTNRALVLAAATTSALGLWQGYLTREAIKSANRQAKAAEDANKISRDVLEMSKRQSAQSEKDSRELLRRTIQSSQLDERAWVGVTQISSVNMENGKSLVLYVDMINTGKTLALNYSCRSALVVRRTPLDIENIFSLKEWKALRGRRSVVFPGMHTGIALSTKDPMTNEMIAEAKAGTMAVYVTGDCQYQDVFHIHHRTEFCSVYDPRRQVLLACPTHNTAN